MAEIAVPLTLGILLLGILTSFSLLVQTYNGTNQSIERARNEKMDRDLERSRTRFEVLNVNILGNNRSIEVNISNTGQQVIRNPDSLLIFSDILSGIYEWIPFNNLTEGWNFTISNDIFNPLFWDPDENLIVTIWVLQEIPIGIHYLVLSTSNGITDIFQWTKN